MNPPWYDQFITVSSTEIVIVTAWLAAMLLLRSARLGDWSGASVCAILYVVSSLLVFAMIAGRQILAWPWEVAVFALVLKALAVSGVAIFAYLKMREEVL